MLFILVVFSFLCLSNCIEIPGCPDIAQLSATANELEGEKLAHIKCVCAEESQAGIEVNCVFGASLDDLATVLDTIGKLNKTVQQINLNHVTISNKTSLLNLLEFSSVRDIESIEIKNCHEGSLEFTGTKNGTPVEMPKLQELQILTIENCGLTEMPAELISRTIKLQSISLNNNKIEFITVDQLKSAASSLMHLDLTENLIGNVELGAFKQLKQLETLLIGEHNFANVTLLEEIAQLDSLETLDLTRIDGINGVGQLEFTDANRLERLVLTGCNIKFINSSDFSAFSQLKELDMRVNLIEKLEPGSFAGLHSLERISLAGNFIRGSELRADRWTDLKNLTQLDLGWNELKQLRENSFGPDIGTSLRILSLRSNEKLAKIEDNAFLGLDNLVNLNLSGSALEKLDGQPFNGLNSLELLDLSGNNITSMDSHIFEPVKKTLKSLNLANNKLRTLDADVLTSLELAALEELDISENNWLCDKNILKVADWIRNQYSNAAKSSRSFLLVNAAKTICSRPYSLQGKNLMDLKATDVGANYNEKLDTTTVAIVVENTTEPVDQETTTLIDFSKLILDIGTKNDSLDVNVDQDKPSYDINIIKYGQKPVKEADNAWVSVVIVGLLILTISGILFAIRQRMKSSQNEEPQQAST